MFSLFGNKSKIKPVDRIALTKKAKWENCLGLSTENTNIIFIAWFDETFNEFNDFVRETSLKKPEVILAKEVQFMRAQNAAFIFLEHYPLYSKDHTLFEKLQLEEVIIYTSLDEPLLLQAGSEKIRSIMHSLGMKENEVLEHKLISAAIKNLQQKR